MSCVNNCSAHGQCLPSSVCSCDANFIFNDCSAFVSTGVRSAYQTVRWSFVAVAILSTVMVAWRLTAVVITKRRTLTIVSFPFDPQILALFLVVTSMSCLWIALALANDIEAYEDGVLVNIIWGIAAYVTILAGLIVNALSVFVSCVARMIDTRSGGSCVHFFISIFARFHRPSLRVCFALKVVSISYAVVFLVCITIGDSNATALHARIYAAVGYVVLIIAGISVYALAVLRPPTDPNVMRAQSDAEKASRAQLARISRTVQFMAAIVTTLWVVRHIIVSSDALPYFALDIVIGALLIGCQLLMCMVMGRTSAQTKLHPRTLCIWSAALQELDSDLNEKLRERERGS